MKNIWMKAYSEPELDPFAGSETKSIICQKLEQQQQASNEDTKESVYLDVQYQW